MLTGSSGGGAEAGMKGEGSRWMVDGICERQGFLGWRVLPTHTRSQFPTLDNSRQAVQYIQIVQ